MQSILGMMPGALQNQQTALQNQAATTNRQMLPIFNQEQLAGQEAGTAGQQQQIASNSGAVYNGAYPGAANTALAADGLNPDGSAISGFDPYSATGNSLIAQYSDKVAPQYDNAVTAANHDLTARNLTGANSLAPSEIGSIRRSQASDVANFGRNVGVEAEQEKYNRLGNALSLITGAGNTALGGYGAAGSGYGSAGNAYGNAGSAWNSVGNSFANNASGWGNLSSGYGNAAGNEENLAGGYGQLANGYSGQQQVYQNAANNQADNLSGIAALFPAKALGHWGGGG